MGEKKDIGKLFENKLNKGKKAPKNTLWEKINTSLDEEKHRRKRIFYYWISGGVILTLLGAFLLFGNSDFLKINSTVTKKYNEILENTVSSSEKVGNVKSTETLPIDSLSAELQDEKLSKIATVEENQPVNSLQKSEGKESINTSEKKVSKSKSLDETFTVSEKFYYYNSRDGRQIVTQDKKEIDSLILKNKNELDSANIKKKDTLK
ncbi:hypothetical protein LS48_09945 [Aequorivita aquimaris]|uniref:Uncharacterized protein n=1 Tax=Aequorivita aquimaris TaxID=1548749 RepID=A0A137RHC7_9FLAO|nr:hypothetical protein [Aequorivita aquimaris]KXN98861.1 hypothetical protein LS48_09945 [Aequorivita aquimaris]